MKAYINGITFTTLWSAEEIAIVHADATLVDESPDELEERLANGSAEDYLIPELYKGMIVFELEDGKTAMTPPMEYLLREAKELHTQFPLRLFNVRKDFSLILAHAQLGKAIYTLTAPTEELTP